MNLAIVAVEVIDARVVELLEIADARPQADAGRCFVFVLGRLPVGIVECLFCRSEAILGEESCLACFLEKC